MNGKHPDAARVPSSSHVDAGGNPGNLISISPPASGAFRRIAAWLFLSFLACGSALGLWHLHRLRQEKAQWLEINRALTRHDLQAASSLLVPFLHDHPNQAEALFLKARIARRLGKYVEAEKNLESCQRVTGVTPQTRLEWDLLRIQQGELGEVHSRLRRTISPEHPDSLLVLEALARGYLRSDRLGDALEACALWITRDPEHPWPYLWRGGVYERLGNFHEALSQYQKALEKAGDDRDVILALGAVYSRGRQPLEAVGYYERLLARDPDDSDALFGLASCRLELGQPQEALVYLDRALRLVPDHPRGAYLRGKISLDQRDPAGAEKWLREAIRINPDDAEALYQLTLALRSQGKREEAESLGLRLESLRKDIARLNEVIRSIVAEPEKMSHRLEAGDLAFRLGRDEEGVRWLQSALQISGDHRPVHLALANHYQRKGDPRENTHRRLAQKP
ncbi:MAG: tetratricopeptide repeat protein [Gemmataceae bacterium]